MFLFHSCALCRSACRRTLCPPCRADIERLAGLRRCRRCGDAASGDWCGACLKTPPAFDQTHAALPFAAPLAGLIRDFKFHGAWQLARLLAGFVRAPAADVMVPVPLFIGRERWRGFNQARELARALPPPVPPLRHDILRRIADTRTQSQLPDIAARRRNVRGAFQANQNLRGKTVVVVDDVMSSGSTLNEIARTLKNAGAATVINLVVARAGKNGA